MFTNNCRDEVALIFLKHFYHHKDVNLAIRLTFTEVRDRNAKNLQAGSYEAVAEQCDEFFKSIAKKENKDEYREHSEVPNAAR